MRKDLKSELRGAGAGTGGGGEAEVAVTPSREKLERGHIEEVTPEAGAQTDAEGGKGSETAQKRGVLMTEDGAGVERESRDCQLPGNKNISSFLLNTFSKG